MKTFLEKLQDRLETRAKTAIADESLANKRLEICNSCEFLNKIRVCRECGCFVDAKTKLTSSRCPKNKW